jgi:solute carrier family 2, facilitated glucose transporter member 14
MCFQLIIGLASSLVPLYLVEISPESDKNLMGILHNLGLNIGMLSAQIFGQDTLLGTPKLWPVLLSMSSAFILIALAFYQFSPLSPVFLLMIEHKEEKALKGKINH